MSDRNEGRSGDCLGCGAPAGMPPAGPCIAHGTEYAVADIGLPVCRAIMGDGSGPAPTCILPMGHGHVHFTDGFFHA